MRLRENGGLLTGLYTPKVLVYDVSEYLTCRSFIEDLTVDVSEP
jgi:hypothetical protein